MMWIMTEIIFILEKQHRNWNPIWDLENLKVFFLNMEKTIFFFLLFNCLFIFYNILFPIFINYFLFNIFYLKSLFSHFSPMLSSFINFETV